MPTPFRNDKFFDFFHCIIADKNWTVSYLFVIAFFLGECRKCPFLL